MASTFGGRVALVTGAASGIGRTTAVEFGRQGARVAVCDISNPGGEETVRRVLQAGGEAQFFRCDVSSPDEVRATVEAVRMTFGRLDYAFNNAGIEGLQQPTGTYPEEAWAKVIGVNLNGAFYCMRHEIPLMLQSGGGAIVNNASILGQVAFANAPAYTAAKHGLVGLTKCAAVEYGPRGIRVNAVCPGFIETPMLERAGITSQPEMRVGVTALHPIGRLGKPEEIASAVLWLCSEAASFVTGAALLVDGGYVAQ